MSKQEGQQLWTHFQTLPIFPDLKDLYMKCVPAINQFEDKLQALKDELAQQQAIL
jgi:hypothetical protein